MDLGTDRNGWGFGGTGKKSNSRNFEDYGESFGEKFDVIGNVLDLNNGTISWTKNGRNLGVAFNIPKPLIEQTIFFPTISVKTAGVDVRFKPENSKKILKFNFLLIVYLTKIHQFNISGLNKWLSIKLL